MSEYCSHGTYVLPYCDIDLQATPGQEQCKMKDNMNQKVNSIYIPTKCICDWDRTLHMQFFRSFTDDCDEVYRELSNMIYVWSRDKCTKTNKECDKKYKVINTRTAFRCRI
jgi:hypothetical protein